MKKERIFLFLISFVCVLVFLPSLTNFFSADDWFHLRISRVNSIFEIPTFFSFVNNSHAASFYRPIPTQLFFWSFGSLFSINPLPYHFFVMLNFGLSLFLVYSLTNYLVANKKISLISALIYGYSATNFTRLYFLSAFQEVVMTNFLLMSLIIYLRKGKQYLVFMNLFYVLALCSKETAIVFPALLLLMVIIFKTKIKVIDLFIISFVSLVYLVMRFKFYGLPAGDSYSWNFSPIKFTNTLSWYTIWAFGAPENLLNYIGKRFSLDVAFFHAFSTYGYAVIFLMFSSIGTFLISFWASKPNFRILTWSVMFFVISLGPVLFLPDHKFSLELSLPLVAVSLLFSVIIVRSRKIGMLFAISYLALNSVSNVIMLSDHYIISRARYSKNVYEYFNNNYKYKPITQIVFVNGDANARGEWSPSRQLSLALSGSDFFKYYYNDMTFNVIYDYEQKKLPSKNIKINSQNFIY